MSEKLTVRSGQAREIRLMEPAPGEKEGEPYSALSQTQVVTFEDLLAFLRFHRDKTGEEIHDFILSEDGTMEPPSVPLDSKGNPR